MANAATLSGAQGANGLTAPYLTTLTTDTAANATAAQSLVNDANASIAAGTAGVWFRAATQGSLPSTPGASGPNVLAIQSGYITNAVSVSSANTSLVFDAGSNVTVDGGDATDLTFIAGKTSAFYFANSGTGRIYDLGGTNDVITINKANQGAQAVTVSGAKATVNAVTGDDSIDLVSGKNVVNLGSGADLVSVGGGAASVYAGSGADTVYLSGAASLNLYGGSGDLTFVNTYGKATVTGGTGSVTVFGSGGQGVSSYQGGSGGHNLLIGGSVGATTIQGGGDQDTLIAGGNGATAGTSYSLVIAGSGAETLEGNSTGLKHGTPTTTLQGAAGGDDTFLFLFGHGAKAVVTNFINTASIHDFVDFSGGFNPASLSHKTDASGNTTLKLSDGTSVTFENTSWSTLSGAIKFTP